MIVHVLILWGAIAAGAGLGVVVHRRRTHDEAPEYQSSLTFVGAAYGLLLGLLVVFAVGHYTDVRHESQAEASTLVQGLRPEEISLDKRVGIRPQLIDRKGELVEDLVIETTPHTVHVLNVISPGMTSALAFAEWFSSCLNDQMRWTGQTTKVV